VVKFNESLVRAFPQSCPDADGSTQFHYGMMLRDYFAAAVLQGAVNDDAFHVNMAPWLAERAYALADAMLRERERTR
jgi:hypothetical protein